MEPEEIVIHHKKSLGQRIKDFFANPKKRLIFIICAGVVLIGAVGAGLYMMTTGNDTETAKEETPVKKTNFETKYYSELDGTEIASLSDDKYPLAVMVENHLDARPQAGLDKASIIYEAIAEGGITRFMAIFGPREADKVGPVRSARPYYVDWAMGYNAYYAHVGGNINALDQIAGEKVLDLDQFKYSAPYWRDTSLRVSREHTMFSSTLKLREQALKLGYPTESTYSAFKFVEPPKQEDTEIDNGDRENIDEENEKAESLDDPVAKTLAPATDISVNFSTANYNVKFNYDSRNNNYKRILNTGSVQLDRETRAEIAPTNLVVMTVNRTPLTTRINEHGWLMDTIGSGTAKIFQNGQIIEATWKKNSKRERERFYDASGNEIIFNRGQFWICVIPPDSSVTYQ